MSGWFVSTSFEYFSHIDLSSIMADPAARAAWVNQHVDADLQFVYQESGIDEGLQYTLGQHYRTIRRFSAIADDRPGVRAALEADFQVRPDSAASRARIAAVVSAWDTAKHYHEEDVKIRQEAKGMGIPRPLPHTDRSAMLRAVEQARGTEIGEKEQPSTEYIAMILEEIEQDEIAAHSLDKVTSKKDSQSLQLQSSLDQSGRVRITRQRQKGKLPTNTEELRQKLRIEANAWLMVASKMRNKAFLQNLEQRHFDRYTDYLLGEKCYNMQIPGPSGEKVPLSPPWHIILDYEFEMRKKAVKTAQKENRPLHEVLREVTENTELKDLYFKSPVTFSAMQRPQKFAKQDDSDPTVKIKGKHKGKGKGKGDAPKTSYLPGTKLELLTHTPDGKQICYRFNMKGKKCDARCGRVHICRVKGCGANHPAFDHPTTN